MLIRTLDYAPRFRCLAGACPHPCCADWEVVIDEDTARRYQTLSGPLGEKLRKNLRRDEDGDFCFSLDGGRCPFLDGENLCEIHRALGEDATSVTCREHPRFTEDYGPFREITLSASCPEANALLLGDPAPLTVLETELPEEPEDEGDEWLEDLLCLRGRLLMLLEDRTRPVRRRLADFLALAGTAQQALDDDRPEALPELAETWTAPENRPVSDGPGVFPAALEFLGTLEALDPDWRELLAAAETAPAVVQPEALLERIGVYFAFRYLLKAVNDGGLLGRAQLCVLAVLTAERLAAVCGLPEALRRFSREIEHDEEQLALLTEAFRQLEALSPAAFFRTLDS